MEFRILGPFEVFDGERRLSLTHGKQESLLLLLLLHANEVVSTERLIDLLWEEDIPDTAVDTLHSHISRLRHILGTAETGASRILTRGRGYLLRMDPQELDLHRFEHLAARGRDTLHSDPAEAARYLQAALRLWRGSPLGDLVGARFVRDTIAHLEELHLDALEDRFEADLALGRHTDVVGELFSCVEAHPHRERFRRELMLALYRCGRQADALAVFRDGQRLFSDELGVDVGPELEALGRAILRQDPSIVSPGHTGTEPSRVARTPATTLENKSRAPSRLLLVPATAVMVAALVATFLMQPRWDRPPAAAANDSYAIERIDPARSKVVETLTADSEPTMAVVADQAVWIAQRSGVIDRLDTLTGHVESVVIGGHPDRAVLDGTGDPWVLDVPGHTITQLTTSPLRTVRRITLAVGASDLAAGEGAVWVINQMDGTLERIDTLTGDRTAVRIARHEHPNGLAVTEDAVWVSAGHALLELNPSTGSVTARVSLRFAGGSVTYGDGSLWVTHPADGAISRVDPIGKTAVLIPVGHGPEAVVVAAGEVWEANVLDGTVFRIDPATNQVATEITLDGRINGIDAGKDGVWVAVAR